MTAPSTSARVGDLPPAGAMPSGWWTPALTTAERSGRGADRTPDWALRVAHAFGERAHAGPPAGTGTWTDDVAGVVSPLVVDAVGRLGAALSRVPADAVDRDPLMAGFAAHLSSRLVAVVTPALVDDLRRDPARWSGADGRARFADFTRHHTEPGGMTAFLTRYPVLARMLAHECAVAVGTTEELVGRFAADRDRLAATLLRGARPAVAGLRAARGDRHQGGRATTVVELSDGAALVYKPRGVAAHRWFARLVALANEVVPWLGLATVDAVAGAGGHGWAAFVRQVPLTGPEQAGTYFRRVGGLLALLHLVRATDMHHQNLVACGGQPLLVDIETLFQPGGADGADPAAAALADSVARTGLLPAAAGRHGLTDISGVGGDPGQPTSAVTTAWADAGTDRMRAVHRTGRVAGAANRPLLADRPVEVADHAAAVETGFAAVYDAIRGHRGEFAALLRTAAALPVRVVPRPTRHYTALLAKASAPALLRDMRDHERMLSAGLAPAGPACPVGTELADLLNGDVPLVTTRADTAPPGTAAGSGLDAALTRLGSFGEIDRRDQRWIVAASLASRGTTGRGAAEAVALDPSVAGSDELLSAACAIGDRITSTLLGGAGVNWLGLEPVADGRWLVLPMGAGLAHGYAGVALFLAELARLSAVRRYRDVARRVLSPVPALLPALRGQPDLVAAVGAGLYGFGGIGYALARLSTLLEAAEIAEWARAAVVLAGVAAEAAPVSGWADGLAGCAVAMRGVAVEIGCAEAQELADRCVRGLRAQDGAADRPSALTADGDTADRTVAAGPGWWCPDRRDSTDSPPVRTLEDALTDEAERPALRDLTLCHGELGHTDVLAALGRSAGFDRVIPVLRRRAGTVLAVLRRDGPRCATPGGVPTPGLLCGLSGIGYGLLRLGFPDRVPSVLLLEPTPR